VAQLGTHKHPAIVRVRSVSRGEEIVSLCQDHGWQVIVGVEPDEREDISDLEELLSRERKRVRPLRSPVRVAPNDYCPCGSGKKFKKCCGAA
jgi:SWIM/SEC-C metal-binding protein